MGRVLGDVQDIAQEAGAALLVVTHFRKGGTDEPGARRINGVGPGAWGRVLATASVRRKHIDPMSKQTEVTLDFEFVGGEIPDTKLRLRRKIWSDDPGDLSAPLHYSVEQLDSVDDEPASARSDLSPAARKLLEALDGGADPATIKELGDRIADRHGHGLRRETCSKELHALLEKRMVQRHEDGPGRAARWSLASGSGV